MKIGILTFHWATNYGAILQCYALQSYLEQYGHKVDVINYKPVLYDEFSLKRYLRYPALLKYDILDLKNVVREFFREKRLVPFRKKYLHLTKRLYTCTEVSKAILSYDVLISGSDQILNPSFAQFGEGDKTSTYFLPFTGSVLKIGYAVSFGCEKYPVNIIPEVKDWIQNFDKIGVRETSGLNILQQLHFCKFQQVVPDPTILLGKGLFDNLNIHSPKEPYVYVYMLRGTCVDKSFKGKDSCSITYSDHNGQKISVIKWLEDIYRASYMITNSYHGMIMAILSHTPFVIILERGSLSGMNDRFFTLLSRLGLENRVVENIDDSISAGLNIPIIWEDVDGKLDEFRKSGERFLNFNNEQI